MIYEFELYLKGTEVIKNIYCAKYESTVDSSTVTKWFKKYCSGYKSFNDQARSGRPMI